MAETDIARLIAELNAQHAEGGDVSARLVSPATEVEPDEGTHEIAARSRGPAGAEGLATPVRSASSVPESERLEGWLREVMRQQGSDLLLVSQAPPSALTRNQRPRSESGSVGGGGTPAGSSGTSREAGRGRRSTSSP